MTDTKKPAPMRAEFERLRKVHPFAAARFLRANEHEILTEDAETKTPEETPPPPRAA